MGTSTLHLLSHTQWSEDTQPHSHTAIQTHSHWLARTKFINLLSTSFSPTSKCCSKCLHTERGAKGEPVTDCMPRACARNSAHLPPHFGCILLLCRVCVPLQLIR